jgi:hypothetical protein
MKTFDNTNLWWLEWLWELPTSLDFTREKLEESASSLIMKKIPTTSARWKKNSI